MQLVARHDPAISARFMDGSVLTRYTSKKIQNEILATLADMVRDEVIEEVKSSKFFSILVDVSKDISKNEQISIVLRFVSKNKIQECFLDLKKAHGLDAKSLSGEILKCLKTYGLDVESYLVGQGYDGHRL